MRSLCGDCDVRTVIYCYLILFIYLVIYLFIYLLHFSLSVNGEVPCKFCVSKQRKIEYDLAQQPTPVEKHIIQQESEIFVTPEESEER